MDTTILRFSPYASFRFKQARLHCVVIVVSYFASCRFKVLGTMMAKALLDGLFFPLRISFALARCICGQELDFDDLGSIIDHNRWESLKWLRQAISTGTPISDAEWMKNFGCFLTSFALPTWIAEPGSKGIKSEMSKELLLVKDGQDIDVTRDNAADYLREFERLHLRDGVLLQLRALKSGFYSIIPQNQVAVLGPSGLLHLLGCFRVPEFDDDDMNEGIVPQQPYTRQSGQFLWLLETLKDLDQRDRSNFLRFVTGAPCLPSNGFRGLKFRGVSAPITVQDLPGGDSRFPFAGTCHGFLKLPL